MIIPVDFCQVNLKYTGTDLPTGAEMTFGLDHNAFVGGPQDVADAVDTAYVSGAVSSVMDNDIKLSAILVKFGPNSTGASFEKTVSHSGTAGSGGSVPSVAALIKKSTALGGHAGKGRMYMPGVIASNYNNQGLFTGGAAAAITAVWQDFHDDLVAADLIPVLLHAAGSPISTPTVTASWECDAKLATQRRRLRR